MAACGCGVSPTERAAESTWTRLRRRKVVQWGLVYIAGAWGFLQGLEVGLPVVLVLAWYHGDRGQQRVSTPEFAILTLLLLLAGGATVTPTDLESRSITC